MDPVQRNAGNTWSFQRADVSGSTTIAWAPSLAYPVLFSSQVRAGLHWVTGGDESGDTLANVKLPASSSSDQFDSGSIMVWRAIFMSGSTNVLNNSMSVQISVSLSDTMVQWVSGFVLVHHSFTEGRRGHWFHRLAVPFPRPAPQTAQ